MTESEKLLQQIPVKVYERIPELMGITPTRRTQMLNNVGKMTYEEIEKLSVIIALPIEDLIHEFHCGYDVLTLREMELKLQNENN